MIISEADYIAHYGVLRKSGRYPWGSGDDQNSRNRTFLDTIDAHKRDGFTEKQIADQYELSVAQLRALRSIATNEEKAANIAWAHRLREKGMSPTAIGKEMGRNESSVRDLLAPGAADKAQVLFATSNALKARVDEGGFLDIGTGAENHMGGISATKLNNAVEILKEQGYEVHPVLIDTAAGPSSNKTKTKVLCPPGTTYRDVAMNKDKVKQFNDFSEDGGRTVLGLHPPISINPKRVAVNYAEDGGSLADGVIYVRPGKQDISIGANQYAQVRIQVGDGHYLKGMAVYKDDLPPGKDLVFNTNKSKNDPKIKTDLDAMKPLKRNLLDDVDEDNPFGSTVRQKLGVDDKGNIKVLSAMNIVGMKEGSGEEGGWDQWSKSLSTQMLSKQSPVLAKQQLDLTYKDKRQDLDEILRLTNPAVKRKLLESYADGADSAAVHLKAKALPGQATKVILPVNTLKDTEAYVPTLPNGTRVALIRYPHGGVFEIPELTVNNNHVPAQKLLGKQAKDAIGINAKVAAKLSGADFDGDTVIVIPNNKGLVRSAPSLQKLKGFDPQATYPQYEGMKVMSARTKGIEMGKISNLITDMTIKGATDDELARAVRHSMVVIDAEKHKLNYRQSAKDNGITQLTKKYQPRPDGSAIGGAATLISRATSEYTIPERKLRPARLGGPIDPATGKLVYTTTDKSWTDAKGRTRTPEMKVAKLAFEDDAYKLSSGTPMEDTYASHSNKLKALANEARREYVNTPPMRVNPAAKAAYPKEVASLKAKLETARYNRPLERQAQVFANAVVAQKRAAKPDMDQAEIKKVRMQALSQARARTNAQAIKLDITPSEWGAIQSGAISNNILDQILMKADLDQVKAYATPRDAAPVMTSAKQARAKAMVARGLTQAEIAESLGVSLSTVKLELNGG